MNGEALKPLALELVEVELAGNRYNRKYQRYIKKAQQQFFEWAEAQGKGDLQLMTKADIRAWQQMLVEQISPVTGKPLASGTLADRYSAVKLLFSVLYRAGVLSENITHELAFDIPKRAGLLRRPLSRAELTTILEHFDPATVCGLRDRALFELIYSSGLRVSEASKLLIKDLDLNQRVMIVRGKFSRDRMVPISKVAREFLVLYLDERLTFPEQPVFCGMYGPNTKKGLKPDSITGHFRYILRAMDMYKKEISTHSIRHSTATHLLDNGASIRHVQELLGHQNIETTTRYTHLQIENLYKMYRKYHPREHDLFEVVDEAYIKRLDSLLPAPEGV